MTLTLTDTYGGQFANTYISLVDAESYIAEKLSADDWTEASEEDQQKVLLQAAKDIDSQNWEGQKYFYYQYLQFPRASTEYDIAEGVLNRAVGVDNLNLISQHDEYQRQQKKRVREAQVEQALFLLRTYDNGRSIHREDQFAGAASVSRGVRGYSDSFSYRSPAHVLGPEASDLLRYYRGYMEILRA